MVGFEREFVHHIKKSPITGHEFGRLVKETLEETMGIAGSFVVLSAMEGTSVQNPVVVSRELSGLFGAGAESVLRAIAVRANEYLNQKMEERETAPFRDPRPQMAGPEERFGITPIKQVYLHDHRLKDDLDEYVERMSRERN